MKKITVREKQVLGLICAGLTNLEIAQRLFISKSTISAHVNNMYEKVLGVDRKNNPRAQLVDYTHKYNLLGQGDGGNT